MDFTTLRIQTMSGLQTLHLFQNVIESQLADLKDQRQGDLGRLEMQSKLPAGFRDSFLKSFDDTLTRNFRYSYIVLLLLVVENRLEAICDHIHQNGGAPIRARDLRGGDGLERCGMFLKKLVNLDLDNVPQWSKIHDLAKIRNCIVHAEGRIEESGEQQYLRQLCVREVGLTSEGEPPNDILVTGNRFCLNATQYVISSFDQIFITLSHSDNSSLR